MNFRRLRQVISYGWKDAASLSSDGTRKNRLSIFIDIILCFLKYNVWSNQYKKERLHLIDNKTKKEICIKYKEQNDKRDKWVSDFFANYRFLYKWSNFKYECSADLQSKRSKAYKKQYGLGDNCFIGYGVIFHRHHYYDSKIITGNHCLIAEQTNIDFTGGLILEDEVSLSEGVKILTHNHDLNFSSKDMRKGCILTPLIIRDHAWIGTHAIIMPGVKEIGRGAIISADSYVNSKVPPYAIVMGNPAKIVGFKLSPEEVKEYEGNNYSKDNRIDIDKFEKIYKKFFINRISEIKQFTKI